MFTIDFTKPFLYKDIIYFNQGNLAANNILRCKLATGGDESLEGYIATVTFKTLSHSEINESVDIVDNKNCIVDIKFPSNALEVGVNELEVILTKGEGIDKVVTPSPVIKYEVWQCLTTGNGIQGDSNYPILIDLMSEVNNTVMIANNASATADASLKQTAKMLDVVNTNISKANEAIDNTNSAKDKALNAVEEVNLAKDNLISEVNTAKNTMIEDINSSKESILSDISATKQNVIADTNKAIDKMNKDFEALTASQQQDAEVINARDGEGSLNARLERDLAKGKIIYETVEGSYINANDTLDSYLQNIEIKGNTIQNPNNLADIKSVGDKVEGQELYRIPIACTGKNIANPSNIMNGYIGGGNNKFTQDSTARSIFVYVGDAKECVFTFNKKPTRTLAKGINTVPKFNDILSVDVIVTNMGNNAYKLHNITTKYVVFYYCDIADDEYKIQVEYGTQATQYEPYQEHKLNILSPTPLEKVGDVEDRIIEKDGVWGVEKNIKNDVILNSTDWSTAPECHYLSGLKFDIKNGVHILNNFNPYGSFSTQVLFVNNGTILRVYTDKTLEELKNFIAINGLRLKYPTTKPQFIPLPNSQQVKLKTFADKSNISFECEIEGAIKADVAKSLGASVNSNTQEISDLWDFVLKSNLANLTVALNTLDTKLKLEQLTKTPR